MTTITKPALTRYEYTLEEVLNFSLSSIQELKRLHIVIDVQIDKTIKGHHDFITFVKSWTVPEFKNTYYFQRALEVEIAYFRKSIFEKYGVANDPERTFITIRVVDKH